MYQTRITIFFRLKEPGNENYFLSQASGILRGASGQ
jgi:hypothetical protein